MEHAENRGIRRRAKERLGPSGAVVSAEAQQKGRMSKKEA